METSIFLAKVIGLYLAIMSLFVFFRQKLLTSIFSEMLPQKTTIFVIVFITLILGILLIVSHNIWVWGTVLKIGIHWDMLSHFPNILI